MFHEVVDDPGAHTPDELYEAYEAELVAAIDELGVDRVAAETGVDEERIAALANGEAPEFTLEEAAGVLALLDGTPGADDIVALSRDALMMGMSNAILDVEALSSQVDGELEPREIQAKVEGRYPVTLREFARLHQVIAERS